MNMSGCCYLNLNIIQGKIILSNRGVVKCLINTYKQLFYQKYNLCVVDSMQTCSMENIPITLHDTCSPAVNLKGIENKHTVQTVSI